MGTAEGTEQQETGERIMERETAGRKDTEDIRLAEQMLDVTRDRLLEWLPYMNRALFSMQVTFYDPAAQENRQEKAEDNRPVLPPGIGTDGRLIYADAGTVIGMYERNRVLLARVTMHMIFHCLFSHPFHYRHMDRPVWDLASDAAVEYAVLSLEVPDLGLDEDWETKRELELLKNQVGEPFTAERIYRWLEDAMDPQAEPDERFLPGTELRFGEVARQMHRDLHVPWLFADADLPEEVIRRGGEEEGSRWRSISRGVQHDMEMHEKNQSLDPGSLSRVFSGIFEKKHSYADFLRRFAKLMEDLHINSEEFDYIYYMYGLKLFGRMPLIEPLEYRETDRIRDFVIAIDTSGSCQGKIVESFLHRTWDVMKEAGIFTGKLNLHIIQADSRIQRDDVIRSQEDFDRYMKDVEIRGSGGTDFRPVFRHVDQLRRNGEFPHLQGLLYFTDGYGIFPQERPEYPVAFVFVKSRWEIPGIPGWAYRTVFDA